MILTGVNPSDPNLLNDEDIYVSYRRPELVKIDYKDDDDLSEDIQWRLFLARQLALLKYREVTEKKRA